MANTDGAAAESLRRFGAGVADAADDLAEQLTLMRLVASSKVARAFRVVPRHVFAPEAKISKAYAMRTALPITDEGTGGVLFTVPAPDAQAQLLGQADIGPGMRVLHVGADGVTAALLRVLVGDTGHVTTMTSDKNIATKARDHLGEAGFSDISVVCSDVDQGWPSGAPYDRIVVTQQVWDVPHSWAEHLVDGGILIVPLRVRGFTRCVQFTKTGDGLVSDSSFDAEFDQLPGDEAHSASSVPFPNSRCELLFDDNLPASGVTLAPMVERAEVLARWTDIHLEKGESWESLLCWLMTQHDGAPHFRDEHEVLQGITGPHVQHLGVAVTDGTEVAVLVVRRNRKGRCTLGALTITPKAFELVDYCCAMIRTWQATIRDQQQPHYRLCHSNTVVSVPDGATVVHKKHCAVILTWQ